MDRRACFKLVLFVILGLGLAGGAGAQDQQKSLNIYGYFATRFEKTFNEPSLQDGGIVKETAVGEWSNPYFNLMMQHQLDSKFKAFVNLNGSGSGNLDVRNFWGEWSGSPQVNLRLGKIYRKFGLYNELLDAVPTYYGIEPPELFDADHLIVSRTTTAMLYGQFDVPSGMLGYSVSTDNGEGDPFKNAFPVGYDLRFRNTTGLFTIGTSGYNSFGPANSDVAVGEGSPKSGVLPWMSEDRFWVLGGYTEINYKHVTLQTEYWHADHNATRDVTKTEDMITSAGPNAGQLARLQYPDDDPTKAGLVNPNGDYAINTSYVRAGYSLDTRIGEVGPYLQWDYYSNPETIASKTYGGDNEAGASDDGKFVKWTLGVVFRPVYQVAVKLDGSQHRYVLGGQNVSYPEMRFDVSYIF